MRSANVLAVLVVLATVLGCAVETADETTADSAYEPARNYDVPGTPVEPNDDSRCVPDITYEIEGQAVTVPGYCPERGLERPTIGDPDPSNGLDDVLHDHGNEPY